MERQRRIWRVIQHGRIVATYSSAEVARQRAKELANATGHPVEVALRRISSSMEPYRITIHPQAENQP